METPPIDGVKRPGRRNLTRRKGKAAMETPPIDGVKLPTGRVRRHRHTAAMETPPIDGVKTTTFDEAGRLSHLPQWRRRRSTA